MSYADRIRQASSPPEALLAIAEGIDAVLARLEDAPTYQPDPWAAGWDDHRVHAEARQDFEASRGRPDNTAAIAAVELALATETDGQERQALEARLRLLKDDGQSIDTEPEAGRAAVSVEVGDQVVTTLPTPSPERQLARAEFARKNEVWEFSVLPEAEFVEAFCKGGPLWLYHTGRDEVLAMPYEWRQWMVEDINLDSPRTAQEVGRDMLKDESTGNKAVALDALEVSHDD